MMAVAVVDDVLVLHLESRQQVPDPGDYPRRTHGGADRNAVENHVRIAAAVTFRERRLGKGNQSVWNAGRLHCPQQGLNPIDVVAQQADRLMHNGYLKI